MSLFLAALVGVGAVLLVRSRLAKTPISLAGVQSSRGAAGCELIVSVDRRDPIVGASHGARPSLERAWLSDGSGHQLPASPLLPLPDVPSDNRGSPQFGWRVAASIPDAPDTIVFHATFTAPGADPFEFEQELRAGLDYNFKDAPKAS